MMRSLSENHFRCIFERSPFGVAVVDAKSGRFIAVNPRFAAIVGLSEAALAGVDWLRLTHPEDLPLQQERMAQLAAGTIASFQIDKRYLRADGRSAWWRLTVSVLDSDADGLLRLLGVVEDIGERKRLEESLRISEEKFRSLVEFSSDCIWEVDASGRYSYLSPQFEHLTGHAPEEFLGRHVLDLLPDDASPALREEMAAVLAAGQPVIARRHPVRHRDGRWRIVEFSGVPLFGAADDYLGLRGVTRDVTERVQQEQANSAAREVSERRLGALVAQGLAGAAEADLEGRLTYVNDRYCQIVGHAREALLGRHLSEFTTPEDWAHQQSLFAGMLAGQGASGIMAKRYVRRDGTLSHAQVAFVLVCDVAGVPVGTICLVTDTNELKRTEDELRDSEQRYRALSAELERKVERRTAELMATKERIVDAMARVLRSEMKFRAVFEQSPLGIALVDSLGGLVLEANERFATICGCSEEHLAQLDWSRFLPPDELPQPWGRGAPTDGAVSESFRIDQRHQRQGQEAWMRITLAPLNIEAEGRCCHLALVEDITRQKEHERELEQAREAIIDTNLALQAANAELKQLATTDPLTGAWNRRHFQQVIAAEIKQALRYGQQLSLLLFDLDHFKSINDRHGHQVGDQVLVALTRLLQRNLRSTDVLARWGGEEFAVVMPHCGANEAASLAEKLRALIAGWEFADVGSVTVSCGLAEYQPPETLDSWLKRADDALYAAKSSGRNVLCQAA